MKKGKDKVYGAYFCNLENGFELPQEIQELLQEESDACVSLWNEARDDILSSYERIKPLREPIEKKMQEARQRAEEVGFGRIWDKKNKDVSNEDWKKNGIPEEFINERKALIDELRKVYKENGVTMFDHNTKYANKRLTGQESFFNVPVDHRRSIIKWLHGSFLSFLVLRGAGDKDAKPPREREEKKFFYAIKGESNVFVKDNKFVIGMGKLGRKIEIPIQGIKKLFKNRPLRELLSKDAKIKSFVLSRRNRGNPDRSGSDLSMSGFFRLSISYELPKPAKHLITPENTAFLAVGSRWLGVISSKGEEIIKIPARDNHWMPIIGSIESCLKKAEEVANSAGKSLGNRKRRRLLFGAQKKHSGGRQKCFAKMGRQQKQDDYEIIAHKLLRHGSYFFATNLVIRSKPGKLADAEKPERGGFMGPNFQVQSTGVTSMVRKLKNVLKRKGGVVREVDPPAISQECRRKVDSANKKLIIARILRDEFMAHRK